jgi:peptide/nickel transport system ATP-binding protein
MYLGKVVELIMSETIFGGALHPYTEALLSSTPIPDPDVKKKRIILEGGVPGPINPLTGCRFHPRCPKVTPLCSKAEPVLIDIGNGHLVVCHRYEGRT